MCPKWGDMSIRGLLLNSELADYRAMDIWAKISIYTVDIWATTLVDIWATQFQLTLKSMCKIERLSQHLPVLTYKVLHEFVLVD